jgi:hypothetical protein
MKMIKGENLKKQMEHVDRILKQYSHRLHKTVTSVITPFPISGYSETPIDDIVLRYMFPASGKITTGGIFIDNMPKQGIDIITTIHQGDLVNSRIFFSKRQSVIIDPNADVSAGDRLIIKIKSVKSEEVVSGIWIAFTWAPEVKDSVVKQYLIEDLEKNEVAD